MVAPPGAKPVTKPLDDPTDATPGLELLQVPPPTSLSAVVAPGHTSGVPVIADGAGLTVTVVETVVLHPEPLVTV